MPDPKQPGPAGATTPPLPDSGTLCLGVTPAPGLIGCNDPGPSASTAGEKGYGRSDLSADHIEKVRRVINTAIDQAVKRDHDKNQGLSRSRFKLLVDALRIVADYRDAHAPAAVDSLIYRDADHYLSGRTLEFSLHTKKDARGQAIKSPDGHEEILEEEPDSWKARAFPAVAMGYEAVKVMSFQKQLISGGKNLLGYGANTPSQVGGLEWSMLGYEHYKTLDAEKEKNIEEPSRVDPVSRVDLERFLPRKASP